MLLLRRLFSIPDRRFVVARRYGSSPLVCCKFAPPPIRQSSPRLFPVYTVPRRVSVFLVCQGISYCGAGIAFLLWPGWVSKMLLIVGLGGSDGPSGTFSLSSTEAGMTRLVAFLLVGVGWFHIHGGLSGHLYFLATTSLNRAVFVPFMATLLATLGARVHLCVFVGVLDPMLTMFTYLVLLGCKDAGQFCFKLLLPAVLAVAVVITTVVAVIAAATTYQTSLKDWLTVQICAVVFGTAVLASLCLSSLRCASGKTEPRLSLAGRNSPSVAQNDSSTLSMFHGTDPVGSPGLEGKDDVVEHIGATPSAFSQPALATPGPADTPQSDQQRTENLRPTPVGTVQSSPVTAEVEHNDDGEYSEAESEIELFETPSVGRTSSSGIFSPPPPRGSQKETSTQPEPGAL